MNKRDQRQLTAHLKKHFFGKKRLIIGVIIAVFLLGGSIGGWFLMSRQTLLAPHQVGTPTTQQQAVPLTVATTQALSDAQKLADTGKASDAQAVYDSAIKAAEDPYQKSLLLLGKATAYFNTAQYDSALANAKASESLRQNENIMQLIAQIYEKMNDSQNAIAYYQKAIALTDESQPSGTVNIQYYQARINVLKGAK